MTRPGKFVDSSAQVLKLALNPWIVSKRPASRNAIVTVLSAICPAVLLFGRQGGHHGGNLGIGYRAHVLYRADRARCGQDLIEEGFPAGRIVASAPSAHRRKVDDALDAVPHAVGGNGFCGPKRAAVHALDPARKLLLQHPQHLVLADSSN